MGTRTGADHGQSAGSASPACRFSASTAPFFLLVLKLSPWFRQIGLVLLSPGICLARTGVLSYGKRQTIQKGNEVLRRRQNRSPTQVWVTWRVRISGRAGTQAAGTKVSLMVPCATHVAWNLDPESA